MSLWFGGRSSGGTPESRCEGAGVVRGLLVFFVIACAVCGDAADAGEVVPVSVFFADGNREMFRLSPDGKRVAFLEFDGAATRLAVGDPRNLANTASAVTGEADGQVFSFLWLDAIRLAYSSRLANQKTRIGCVMLPDVSGEGVSAAADIEAKILVESGGRVQMAGIISRGKSRELVVSVPSKGGEGISDVVAVNPSDGSQSLLHENSEALAVWSVSGNGEVLVGIRCLADGGKELVGIRAGVARILMSCGPDDCLEIAAIDHEGLVAHVITNQGDSIEFARLEAVNLKTGERTVVGEDPLNAADLGEAVFDRAGGRLLACRFFHDRPHHLWQSPELEEDFKTISGRLPQGDIRFRDSSDDGKSWIVSLTTDTEPDAEYFYEGRTRLLVRLDSRATVIPEERLGKMRAVRYRARDGVMVGGYLTVPPGVAESNLPVVVFPHGGPNKRNYWGYDARVQFFASRGYAVFQPNFRGSSGFGRAFQNAGNGRWGRGVMQDDISDGVAWLVESGIADRRRIAIVGGSYGGFAALAGVTFTPGLYACGVCMFGASNLVDFVRDIPDDWKPFHGDIAAKIGNPALPTDKRRLAWQSPVNFTSQIRAPLLVYHGARDRLIRKSQADRFVDACRSNGVDVDYLVSAQGGHGFTDPLDEQAVYIAIERFLSAHIGGKTQRDVPADVEARLKELFDR